MFISVGGSVGSKKLSSRPSARYSLPGGVRSGPRTKRPKGATPGDDGSGSGLLHTSSSNWISPGTVEHSAPTPQKHITSELRMSSDAAAPCA